MARKSSFPCEYLGKRHQTWKRYRKYRTAWWVHVTQVDECVWMWTAVCLLVTPLHGSLLITAAAHPTKAKSGKKDKKAALIISHTADHHPALSYTNFLNLFFFFDIQLWRRGQIMRTQVRGDPQDHKKNPITNDTYILRAMLSGSEVACFSISSPPPPPPAMFFWRTCGFWLTETFVTGCFRLAHTQLCVVIHHVLLLSSSFSFFLAPFVLIILTLLTDLNFIFLSYCQTERK